MKVLIAEDNQNMRQMIRDIIAEPSIELFECSSGIEAIESYEREHPDCVLMDVEMSPVDGITATRVIKKSHPEAKIVIVTQHTDRLTRTAAAEAGADGCGKGQPPGSEGFRRTTSSVEYSDLELRALRKRGRP